MQVRYGRPLTAGVIALGALLLVHWFDAGVLADAQRRAGLTYDTGPFWNLMAVSRILTAGGAIAISIAGWRSRSLVVGACYAAVGGLLVFLPALVWAFAAELNGAAPVAPQPIAGVLNDWFFTLSAGVTGAAYTLGGAMLITGIAVMWSVSARRRSGLPLRVSASLPEPEGEVPTP
jgi:hypothetical protein